MRQQSAHVTSTRAAITVAAALGLLAVAAGCSSSRQVNGSATTTGSSVPSSSEVAAESSVPASTTTVLASETTEPPAPAPSPSTTAPAGGGGGGGAATALPSTTNLQATPGGGVTLPASYSCAFGDAGIPGWTTDYCQEMPSYSDGLMALVLHRNDDGRFAVVVLFRSGTNLVQRYRAEEEGPGVWADVVVELGDYNADDGAEVWVGYRYDGSGGYLDLDVLDPRPDGSFVLGGVQGLDHGVVDLHPGGATLQQAVYAASDPGCCPSTVRQRAISFSGGQWRITTGTDYPAASAPALTGDF